MEAEADLDKEIVILVLDTSERHTLSLWKLMPKNRIYAYIGSHNPTVR